MSEDSQNDTSTMSRDEIEADIANTREDLKKTVVALGDKVNVKKQVKGSVDQARNNAAAGVDHARQVLHDRTTLLANSDAVTKVRAEPVVPAAIAAGVVAAVVGLIIWRRSR